MGAAPGEPGPLLTLVPCPGCAGRFRPGDGPTHRYVGASAGCWALFTGLLAGAAPLPEAVSESAVDPVEVADLPPVPKGAASLAVDAYAAQHHGVPSKQAIQSVAVHLLVLHGVIARGVESRHALWVRQRALRRRGAFAWLEPPARTGAFSIRHCYPGAVAAPCTVEDYVVSVYANWARRHRDQLEAWYAAEVAAD